MNSNNENNKSSEHGRFKIHYRKLFNDEFLLIEIKDSGIIKIKCTKKDLSVILYNSSSMEPTQGLSTTHEELK